MLTNTRMTAFRPSEEGRRLQVFPKVHLFFRWSHGLDEAGFYPASKGVVRVPIDPHALPDLRVGDRLMFGTSDADVLDKEQSLMILGLRVNREGVHPHLRLEVVS